MTTNNELPQKVQGCFRVKQPKCPFAAVIPTLTVEDISGVKSLADCLVHVSNINTTIYIDDKHRYIVTFAGPVFIDGYNYQENPLRLAGQVCYDFSNNRAIVYNKQGNYRLIELGE